MTKFIGFLGILLFGLTASAELFSNSYVSFNLPPRWKCEAEGTEYVCRSTVRSPVEKNNEFAQAIIVLTAKEVGATDSLPSYEKYLKEPKITSNKFGKPEKSVVKDVRTRKIQNQDWVDGLHLGSEIPAYYSRYLATVKSNIAVLVTFSAHQRYYSRYSQDFSNAIQSLVIKAVALPDKSIGSANGGAGGILTGPIGNINPGDVIADGDNSYVDENGDDSDYKIKLLLFGVILVAIGAYIFLKKKKI